MCALPVRVYQECGHQVVVKPHTRAIHFLAFQGQGKARATRGTGSVLWKKDVLLKMNPRTAIDYQLYKKMFYTTVQDCCQGFAEQERAGKCLAQNCSRYSGRARLPECAESSGR